MLRRITSTHKTWATVPLRLALGVIFIAHGAQKVFGAFGGRGLSAFLSAPAPLGLWPSWFWMGAAAFAELLGGVLVLLGLFTRLGALAIAGVMITAIFGVHRHAFFANQGGMEFPLALLSIAITLIYLGGGKLSVDANLRL
ncbi:MAG: DoxX family protein [Acidobacteria bacterium]|nr:DoxX family protein [Acidobacteriota bacterium]